MKKTPAITIELKDHCVVCTSMQEYHKWVRHLNETKQTILSEQITIVDEAETLEELANN